MGNVIYICVEGEEEAKKLVKHEFLDYYLVKEVIKPLVRYINLQKDLIESLISEGRKSSWMPI